MLPGVTRCRSGICLRVLSPLPCSHAGSVSSGCWDRRCGCSEPLVTLVRWVFSAQHLYYPSYSAVCTALGFQHLKLADFPNASAGAVWDPTPHSRGVHVLHSPGFSHQNSKALDAKAVLKDLQHEIVTVAPPVHSPSPTGFPWKRNPASQSIRCQSHSA